MHNITRRSALGGLAFIPAAAAAGRALSSPGVSEHTGDSARTPAALGSVPATVVAEPIGRRISRLTDELSTLLAVYDGAQWEVVARPAFNGRTCGSLQPLYMPPRLRFRSALANIDVVASELVPADALEWTLTAVGGRLRPGASISGVLASLSGRPARSRFVELLRVEC